MVTMNVLLVEDNLELAKLIQAFLQKEGFSLTFVDSGEKALAHIKENTVDILLLDIMLPGIDGFAVCQYIRHSSNIPILILSARAGKEDKLLGFELGADDYMEKPIDTDILCAKIKVLLSRSQQHSLKDKMIISGNIKIDQEARIAYLKDAQLELNTKEYELLLLFVQNPGKVLHKEYLFNKIWGLDSESEYQTLTVHIKMLRTKIEEDARSFQRIHTVWGIGYRYEEV